MRVGLRAVQETLQENAIVNMQQESLAPIWRSKQGLPDGTYSFKPKAPIWVNLGKFGSALKWQILVYFMAVWNILRPFSIFYGRLVIYVVVIWYIFPRFGILHLEKSGNPASKTKLGHFEILGSGMPKCFVYNREKHTCWQGCQMIFLEIYQMSTKYIPSDHKIYYLNDNKIYQMTT
jgi:hypothetical protein